MFRLPFGATATMLGDGLVALSFSVPFKQDTSCLSNVSRQANAALRELWCADVNMTKRDWIAAFVMATGASSSNGLAWAKYVAEQEWMGEGSLDPITVGLAARLRSQQPPTLIRLRWPPRLHSESGFGHSPWRLDIHLNRVDLLALQKTMNELHGSGTHWIESMPL